MKKNNYKNKKQKLTKRDSWRCYYNISRKQNLLINLGFGAGEMLSIKAKGRLDKCLKTDQNHKYQSKHKTSKILLRKSYKQAGK